MHHQIGAERDRPGQHRGRDGRIDRQPRARRVRDRGRGGDVGDAPQRIGRRLDPHQPRLPRPHRRAQRREVGGLDELGLAAPSRRAGPASQLRSDQYITVGATTWSPGRSARNTAVAAAMPEANSSAAAPPSREASSASAWSKPGLSARP